MRQLSRPAEGGVLDLVWVRICGLKLYRVFCSFFLFVNMALKTKKVCLLHTQILSARGQRRTQAKDSGTLLGAASPSATVTEHTPGPWAGDGGRGPGVQGGSSIWQGRDTGSGRPSPTPPADSGHPGSSRTASIKAANTWPHSVCPPSINLQNQKPGS